MNRNIGSIRGAAMLCLTLACAAHTEAAAQSNAAAPLLVPQTVAYADGVGNDAIRAECDFPTVLPQQILKQAPEYKLPVQLSSEDLGASKGRVLLIRTILVHAIGGAAFTGPKWARVQVELRNGGKVVAGTELEQSTSGHSFGFSACGVLRDIAESLAGDVLSWVRSSGSALSGPPVAIAVPFPLADQATWGKDQWSEPAVLATLAAHGYDGLAISEMQMRGTLRDGTTLFVEVRGRIDAVKGHDKLVDLKLEFLKGNAVVATAVLPDIKAPEEKVSKFKGTFSLPVAALSANPATTMRVTITDRND